MSQQEPRISDSIFNIYRISSRKSIYIVHIINCASLFEMAADILNVIIEYVFSFPHIHTHTYMHKTHTKEKIHENELDLCLVGHKEYP